MTKHSLSELSAPVMLIAAQDDKNVPVATHARPVAKLLPPHSRYHEVNGAGHFSFMQECLPGALEIVAEDGEAFVCEDGSVATKSRAEIHYEVLRIVDDFLKENDNLR